MERRCVVRRFLWAGLLSLIAAVALWADVIHMKDGRNLQGEILSETDTEVKLKGKFGTLTLDRAQIKSIERKEIDETDLVLKELTRVLDDLSKDKPFPALRNIRDWAKRFPKAKILGDPAAQKMALKSALSALRPTFDLKVESFDELREHLDKRVEHLCEACEAAGLVTCAACKGKGGLICQTCMGAGAQKCASCGGEGSSPCATCKGATKIPCPTCTVRQPMRTSEPYIRVGYQFKLLEKYDQAKETHYQQWDWTVCTQCTRVGTIPCPNCPFDKRGGRTGKVACAACGGVGKLPCPGGCNNGVLPGQCPGCQGTGKQPCAVCKGSGRR